MTILYDTENVLRFWAENNDLQRFTKGVFFDIFEEDGKIEISIRIDMNTVQQDIIDASGLAVDWEKRLIKFQGPIYYGRELFLENLSELKKGKSLRELTNYLNEQIIRVISDYKNSLDEFERDQSSIHTLEEWFKWRSNFDWRSLMEAELILEYVGNLKKPKIDIEINKILKEIKEGYKPIGLISQSKVREALRGFANRCMKRNP